MVGVLGFSRGLVVCCCFPYEIWPIIFCTGKISFTGAMSRFLLWLFAGSALWGAESPVLLPAGVVNAADHSGGRLAPGEIIVLYPSNAGPAVLAGAQLDGKGRVTTSLAETRVLFDGMPAPLSYSVKGEVGAVVPYEVSNKKVTEVVVEYQGLRSAPVTLPVVDSAPALFTLDSTGKGQAGMLNAAGCCNSPRNPAARGSIVALYATGEGNTKPSGVTGSVSAYRRIADYPVPRRLVRVFVGGLPAEIIYAGEAPHAVAGLLQVNFRVPLNAPIGDAVPLVLMIGNTRSPDGVTMAVRSSVQRILVLDSDLARRAWVSRVLRGAGYQVSPSSDAPVDLVVAGLSMAQDLEAIRLAQPRVRVIAVASTLDSATLRSADLVGAQAVVTRPLSAQLLLRRVRQLLRSRPVPYVGDEERPAFYSIRGMPR